MKRTLIVVILGILASSGLSADEPYLTHPPVGLPGTSAAGSQLSATMARLNKTGQVVLKFQRSRFVPVKVTRVLRDGKEVKENHTIYEEVTESVDEAFDPKDIKLLGSDGKPLDKKLLPELLKKERPVLYKYGEYEIDSTFLKLIKEGTPILLLRAGDPS